MTELLSPIQLVAKGKSQKEFEQKVGKVICRNRDALGLKQTEIAQKLNISQPTYSRLETGETTAEPGLIYDICRLFKIDPNTLFGYTKTRDNVYVKETKNVIKDYAEKIGEKIDSKITILEDIINKLEE